MYNWVGGVCVCRLPRPVRLWILNYGPHGLTQVSIPARNVEQILFIQ